PAIDAAGTLTYTPAADANGSATISVQAHDSGGVANGGSDTSAVQTFVIAITAVNDAPSFTRGADVSVAEDAGAQVVSGWASAIVSGPADESAQAVSFVVSVDHPEFFASAGQPAITSAGTLAFTPAAAGTAVVTVTLRDNGGTANGGLDTSSAQTVRIVVTPTGGGTDDGTPPTIGNVVLTITGGLTGDQTGTVGGELLHFTDTHQPVTFSVSAPVQGGTLTDISVTTSDGQSVTATSGSGAFTPLGDGRITLTATATATSSGGLTATGVSLPAIVIADGTPPVVTDLQALQNPDSLSSGVAMRSSMTNDADAVFLNGASWSDDVTLRAQYGINAFPRSGFALRIGIDDLSGVGLSAAQTGYAQAGQSVALVGDASAPGSDLAVRLTGFDGVAESATYTSTFTVGTTKGLYTIHASITDRAGNTTEADLFKAWVDVTAPEVALAVQPLPSVAVQAPKFQLGQSSGNGYRLTQLSPALFVAATPDAMLLWQGSQSDATLMKKLVGTPEVPLSAGAAALLPVFQLRQGIDLVTAYAAAKDWSNAIGQTTVTAMDRAGNQATAAVLAQLRVMHAPDIATTPTSTPIQVRLPLAPSEQISEQPTSGGFTAVYEAGGVQKSLAIGGSEHDENVAWVVGTGGAPHLGAITGSLIVDKENIKYLATLGETPVSPRVLNVPASWQTAQSVIALRLTKSGLTNPFVARTALSQGPTPQPIQDAQDPISHLVVHLSAQDRAVYAGTTSSDPLIAVDGSAFWSAHPGLLDYGFTQGTIDSSKLVWLRLGVRWPTPSTPGIDQAVESPTTAYARPVGHWVVGIPSYRNCDTQPFRWDPQFNGPIASEEDPASRNATVSLDRTVDGGYIRIGYRRETTSAPPTGPVTLPGYLGTIFTHTFKTDTTGCFGGGLSIQTFTKDWLSAYMVTVDQTPGSTGTVRTQAGYHGLDVLKIENDVIATGSTTLRISGGFITDTFGPSSVTPDLDAIRFMDPAKETAKLAELNEPAVELNLASAQAELLAYSRNSMPGLLTYTQGFSQPIAQAAYDKSASVVLAQTNAQQALTAANQTLSQKQTALSSARGDLAAAQAELAAATTPVETAAAQSHIVTATAAVAAAQTAVDAARISQADASALVDACAAAMAERVLANQGLNGGTVQGHVDCCSHVITAMRLIAWQYCAA
nr:hypothetical protein [Planctomycetota bacterium]